MMRQGLAERVCLAVVVGSAIVALARIHELTVIWALLALPALSVLWRIPHVPAALVAASRTVLWGLLIAAAGLQAFLMTNQLVIIDPAPSRVIVLCSYGLSAMASLFLLGGPKAFEPGKTLFPAVIGAFIVAGFGWQEFLYGSLAVATGAYMAIPLMEDRAAALRRRPGRAILAVVLTGLTGAATVAALPPLQDRITEATLDYDQSGRRRGGFGATSRLGDIEELKLSDAVVLRVFSEVPRKLRGRAFVHFDGSVWKAASERATLPEIEDGGEVPGVPGRLFRVAPAAAETVVTRIFSSDYAGDALPVPTPVTIVRAPVGGMQVDPSGAVIRATSPPPDVYGVVHGLDEDQGRPITATAELLAACLRLPDDTDARFRALAAELSAAGGTPGELLERTVERVRTSCTYSLEVGAFRSRQPAAEFLFEKKRGYCQYFAAATAVLLRLEGIPCRYVAGYNVAPMSKLGGHFVVRELDAHAWLEAFLPGRGWVEADPTPLSEYASLHATIRRGRFADALEWARGAFMRAFSALRHRGLAGILADLFGQRGMYVVLGLVLGGVLLRSILRHLRAGPRRAAVAGPASTRGLADVPPDLVRLLARVDAILARRGAPRAPSRAPLEHLAAIPAETLDEPLRTASREVVEAYYRACFAGRPVGPGEIRDLAGRLGEG